MKIWLIGVFLCFSLMEVYSTDLTPKKEDDQHRYHQLYLGIGYPFVINSNEFFDDFNKYLGGKENTLDGSTMLQLMFKLKPFGDFRIGFDLAYYNLKYNDKYIVEVPLATGVFERELVQEIEIQNLPIYLVCDYVPFQRAYKSYFGVGVGFVSSTIRWTEYANTNTRLDLYKGGAHFEKSETIPSLKFHTGVELAFDETLDYSFLGSLCFELSYTLNYSSSKIFEKVPQQNFSLPVDLGKGYNITPGSLNLSMLVSFNLSEKFFTANKN